MKKTVRAGVRDEVPLTRESFLYLFGYLPMKQAWHSRLLHSNSHIPQPPLRVMHPINGTCWIHPHAIRLAFVWWRRRTVHSKVVGS